MLKKGWIEKQARRQERPARFPASDLKENSSPSPGTAEARRACLFLGRKVMSSREPKPPLLGGLLRREDLIIAFMAGLLAWVITLGLRMGFAGL
ncbi:hypothetical protein [Bradyrhizobium sp. JYMT SZCCT0428]|uniref:hypothetical protein n=1 Tax=Bradyrhizobium sp. JYMT SZCCT0428 TaxID=2807673 RepID=UPI001BA6F70D|nr:hypothetical protein [Bradyrhizobium sp. JYMT SZCCT0428]MBR1154610.1 hypothetical protein [Bradyrhizobium sp. JYMT SZCCT0428]